MILLLALLLLLLVGRDNVGRWLVIIRGKVQPGQSLATSLAGGKLTVCVSAAQVVRAVDIVGDAVVEGDVDGWDVRFRHRSFEDSDGGRGHIDYECLC